MDWVNPEQLAITSMLQVTNSLQGFSQDNGILNAGRLRALPLVAGAAGIVGVLLNRLLSGVRVTLTITSQSQLQKAALMLVECT